MKDWPAFLVNTIAPCDLLNHRDRLSIYRWFGMDAKDAYIWPDCRFKETDLSNVHLGDRTFINSGAYIDNGESITLEDNVCLSPHVRLLTTSHAIGESGRRVGHTCFRKPIVIGRGTWVGCGVVVLPGVSIGKGCMIAAGAIVTQDCEPDWLYVGVPAVKKRYLEMAIAHELHLHP